MSSIFISHSHDDSDFAEILHTRLAQAGFRIWRDVSISVGEDWRREIDQAIKEAVALIVVMTPRAKESEYVTYEWAFAVGAGVKVIPLRLKETTFHPRLESLQYLDFTNRNARPWARLIELLPKAEAESLELPQEEPPKPEVRKENKDDRDASDRMLAALREGHQWSWRTVKRLSTIGGVSESDALEILRSNPKVELGANKNGLRLARLRLQPTYTRPRTIE